MIFKLKNVCYKYDGHPDFALQSINTNFDSTQITGIAGENEGGKTTLMKIIMRRLIDYSGVYEINGEAMDDYTNSLAFRFQIGYSSDSPALDEALTGLEILEIVNEIRGGTLKTLEEDLVVFRNYLHIDNWIKDKTCSEYSAGMRKKVSICAAFCGSPKYVILDEPVNALDPISILGLENLLLYKKDMGTGTLVSSHILHFIEKVANNVLLLKTGMTKFQGKLSDLRRLYPNQDLDEIYFALYHKVN
jgi:ABC-2 type transport system ATP-binding protein